MSDVIRLSSRSAAARAELMDHARTNLIGATLSWKRYRSWTSSLVSGRCELCDATFTEGGTPGLNSGYSVLGGGPAGQDDYRWICAVCYEIQRDHFCWTVLDTRGNPSEPPDLLDTAFGWMAAWPAAARAYGASYGDEPDARTDGAPSDEPGLTITVSPLPRRW
jgi:hypothetical protein